MTDEFLSIRGTSPDDFGNQSGANRRWLLSRRLNASDWIDPKLPIGTVAFRLRNRGHVAQRRANIFLLLLFISVLSALLYFIVFPLYIETTNKRGELMSEISFLHNLSFINEREISISTDFERTLEDDITEFDLSRPPPAVMIAISSGNLDPFFEFVSENINELGDEYARLVSYALAARNELRELGLQRNMAEGRLEALRGLNPIEAATSAVLQAADQELLNRAIAQLQIANSLSDEHENWWIYIADRVPAGILILFLLATLGSLYRYNTRIAGFYYARADALELTTLDVEESRFDDLSNTLAADRVDFRAARTPAEAVTDLTKEVVAKVGARPPGTPSGS